MRLLKIDMADPAAAGVIEEARSVLASGGLVAFPTETVYGLGARGLRAAEVARIFRAKGRPPTHPLILHVAGPRMAASLARSWSSAASRLAEAFWPGPLTLVVPRSAEVPDAVTGGLDTVALRMPRHDVALALVASVGEPLAAPSANAHTSVSPTTAAHVVRSLGDAVDLVLDAGPAAHGIESTVVDVTGVEPRVLRPGALSLEALRGVVPGVVYEQVTARDAERRASPGLAAKHYAPRGRVVTGTAAELPRALDRDVGSCVGAVVWSEAARVACASRPGDLSRRQGPVHVLPSTAEAYARSLYAALHDIDANGCDLVFIEEVPADGGWWAVADRLRRAGATS